MLKKRNLNDLDFDEFFLYEYQRCQERAYRNSCINGIRNIYTDDFVKKPMRLKRYVPYSETLKYLILKKIYFKTSEYIMKKKSISLEEFKNISLIIIEKELSSNAKKFDKGIYHYQSIRTQIIKELEQHFKNIFPYDLENSISSFLHIKIDLKEYLTFRLKSLKESFQKNIPAFEWNGEPIFKFDVINIQKDYNVFNVIITCLFTIDDKLVHRNLFIATLIEYFKIYLSEELNIPFNKLIVYFPLIIERKEFYYEDIVGIFQESDWFKILKTIVEGCTIKSIDTKDCFFCENNYFCFHRTTTINNSIKKKILVNNKNKTEMI